MKKRIEEILAGSPVPEDPIHSKNTLDWLLKLNPGADEALKIAALGHDIERAIEERKVRRENFESYDEFKKYHALNSAKVLEEIMLACGIPVDMVEDVCRLVRLHEVGGDDRADILMSADTLSFFDVNLPHYLARHDEGETLRRMRWGYKKLPESLKELVAKFHTGDRRLHRLITHCMAVD